MRKPTLGLAFDGDGNSLGVITAEGEVIWPDRQMILFSQDVLTRHLGATILFDVKCSRHLDIMRLKNRVVMRKWSAPGHSFIKAAFKSTGAILAGEMSGHIIL